MLTLYRHSRGFNIIELMVTVSVLAVLLAVGVPSMAEWIRNTQVRALAEALQNGLQKARGEAIKRNRPVTLWLVTPASGVPDATCALSASSPSWVVSLDNPAGLCDAGASPTAAPRIVEVYGSPYGGINVSSKTSDGATDATSATFNSYGQTIGANPIGLINLESQKSGARRLRVELAPGGGIRLCDRDMTAGDPRACQLP